MVDKARDTAKIQADRLEKELSTVAGIKQLGKAAREQDKQEKAGKRKTTQA